MKMSAKPGSNEFEPADEYEPFLRTGEDTLQAVAAGTRLHLCSFPEQTKEEHQCCGQAVKKMQLTKGLWSGQKISGDDHIGGKRNFPLRMAKLEGKPGLVGDLFHHWLARRKAEGKNVPHTLVFTSEISCDASIVNHQETILNFFINHSTNDFAESFNAKSSSIVPI